MKGFLIMNKNNILNLIIKSPFYLIKKHMECVSFSVKKILPFIQLIESREEDRANIYYLEINKLIEDANYIKRKIKIILPNSLLIHISQQEILYLLQMQNNILNKVKYLLSLLIFKKLELPFFILKNIYYKFIQSCVDACNEMYLVIIKFEKFIENGLPKKEIFILKNMVKKVYIIENVSNKFKSEIRLKLFKTKSILPSIESIFLYKTISIVNDISHLSKEIGYRIDCIISYKK